MNSRAIAFLCVIGGIFAGLGWLVDGERGAALAVAVALGLALYVVMFAGDRLVATALSAASGEKPHLDLVELVECVAELLHAPVPRVVLLESDDLNAMTAEGRRAGTVLLLTTRLVAELPPEELTAVVAHELGHIRRGDTFAGLIALYISRAVLGLGVIVAFLGILIGRRGGGAVVAVGILAPAVVLLMRLAMGRSSEYGADSMAARAVGFGPMIAVLERLEKDAATVAPSGLEPIAALSFAPPQGNLFSAHPTFARRIARLQRQQDCRR